MADDMQMVEHVPAIHDKILRCTYILFFSHLMIKKLFNSLNKRGKKKVELSDIEKILTDKKCLRFKEVTCIGFAVVYIDMQIRMIQVNDLIEIEIEIKRTSTVA